MAEHWQQDLWQRRLKGILDSEIEANTKEGLAMPGINRTRILSFLDFLPSFLDTLPNVKASKICILLAGIFLLIKLVVYPHSV